MKNNDGKHIDEVVNRTPCKRHKRSVGTPCWMIIPDTRSEEIFSAVCGSRIRSAGFVGKVSESSVQSKRKAAEAIKKEVRV